MPYADPERYREYQAWYHALPSSRHTKAQKSAEYRRTHPLETHARSTVSNAVRLGKLHKGSCEVCGQTKVEAHHDDYTKPLEVRWLCRKHHNEIHP